MSNFYRRPGVNAPSSGGSPLRDNDTRHSRARSENLPSRIGEGQLVITPHPGSPRPGSPPQTTQTTADRTHVRDILLHSLLEDRFLREAEARLGKDRSHEEVQQLARSLYESFYEELPGVSGNDHRIASDGMRRSRLAVQEGLGVFARSQMNQLVSHTAAQTENIDQQDSNSGSSTPRPRIFKNLPVDTVDERARSSLPIPVPENTALSQQYPLQGSPGVHVDRYRRDFTELSKVGKGGYGKVFKVRHKLDDSVYAVKRIVVSKAIFEKMHREGPIAMKSLLEEVRALARLDHKNIVRYFHAWIDYASASLELSVSSTSSSSYLSGPSNLLEDASVRSGDEINPENLPFGDLSFDGNGGTVPDIVFGYSDSAPRPEHSEVASERQEALGPTRAVTTRKRSATLETIFSTSASDGAEHSTVEKQEEEADETIPRSDLHLTHDSSSARRREYVTESNFASQLVPSHLSNTVLTLNVQMSLYDTNLAIFINPFIHSDSANTNPGTPQPTHCFHPCISLELLNEILEGVEYLHSYGIVHRDLKPANIFLSISAAKIPPAGSVDLRTCSHCPNSANRPGFYVNPRIGDLGLVATLADAAGTASSCSTAPVGTEFYRPKTPGTVSEKLDIFSLGVITFELLRNFNTRSERADTLTALKAGKVPSGFAAGFGKFGPELEALVLGMVEGQEEERFSCEEAKGRLREIILKMHSQ